MNEAIGIIKSRRKLRGEKKSLAEEMGYDVSRPEGEMDILMDLQTLKAQFEHAGSYPELIEAARRWDGESAVPNATREYLAAAKAEREQMEDEKEMNAAQYTMSFSVFSPAEASGLHALRALTQGEKEARFRSDTLGEDVILPLGSAGRLKDAKNPKSKVVDAFGFKHLISMRMAHGESLREACYTACKAVMAAVNGRIDKGANFQEHQKEISLNGYRSVVRLKWLDNERAWMVTGYKEGNINSSAGDRQRAKYLAESYALDSFDGLKEVGAALDYAISRLAREYKQNNADVRRKVANRYDAPAFALTDAKAQGLFKDGVMAAGNALIVEPGVSFSVSAQHASPHLFKLFDLLHIGKGEGAQAYGWGQERQRRALCFGFAHTRMFSIELCRGMEM